MMLLKSFAAILFRSLATMLGMLFIIVFSWMFIDGESTLALTFLAVIIGSAFCLYGFGGKALLEKVLPNLVSRFFLNGSHNKWGLADMLNTSKQ